MNIFRIEMLPAREGDCLWIEYGDSARPHRILIDGGRPLAWQNLKPRFNSLPDDQRIFELLICTHVDADHIEGLLKLVKDPELAVTFKDVWFNGYKHLDEIESLGPEQGEAFSEGIESRNWPWNAAFNKRAVVIPRDGVLPRIRMAGDMEITLLSPNEEKLIALRPVWEEALVEAFGPRTADEAPIEEIDLPSIELESFGPPDINDVVDAAASVFKGDKSEANGSSICVILEFGGKRALLTGDVHAPLLVHSLRILRNGGERLKIHAMKLSHHGSKGTHSLDVMNEIDCKKFLVSTDGSRHKHPHIEAIARTVTAAQNVELIFNYKSDYTEIWDARRLKDRFQYSTKYPGPAQPGLIRVDLI